MAKLNRTTYKDKVSDFINRVSPFTNPLIQKTEDKEVRDDAADSVYFREATEVTLNPTGSAITADFTNAEEVTINTTGAIGAAFAITLTGLEANQNSVGKLSIVKKLGDKVTFVNASIYPFDIDVQGGKSKIQFEIQYSTTVYRALYKEVLSISDSITTNDSTTFASSASAKALNDRIIDLEVAPITYSAAGITPSLIGPIAFRKYPNDLVVVSGELTSTINYIGDLTLSLPSGALPIDFRPQSRDVRFACASQSLNSSNVLTIGQDGSITIFIPFGTVIGLKTSVELTYKVIRLI